MLRVRQLTLRLLVLVFGIAMGLAILEAGLRVFQPREDQGWMVADPVLHHRLNAATRGRVLGVEFVTNSLGLRDREISIRKPHGTFRILMLGDSFTQGLGLDLEDTVAKRVERQLNQQWCSGTFEVINGGVASHSPILEYLFLKEVGLRLEPDLVVLNFDMTDVHDDWIYTRLATFDSHGLPIAVRYDRRRQTALLLPPLSLPRGLGFVKPLEERANQLRIYQMLRRRLGSFRLSPERLAALGLVGNVRYDIEGITRDGESPSLADGWRLTTRYIAGIHALARARGLRFTLVVYPHAQQVAADESPVGRTRHGLGPGLYASERPFQILEDLGRREGFAVINLLHLFRAREAVDGPLFRHDDIHHTPRGARVFAEGVLAGLRHWRLVPCV